MLCRPASRLHRRLGRPLVRQRLLAVLVAVTVAASAGLFGPVAPPAQASQAATALDRSGPAAPPEAGRPASWSAPADLGARSAQAARPVVDGVPLAETSVAGHPFYHDPAIDPVVLTTAGEALAAALVDVPELSGLPPFATPISAYLLADDERFRLALTELAGVRVDLVSEDIGGYTIERDGTMLVFFAAPNVAAAPSAVLGYAHELTHLAVREATRRKPLPQWFNEGYASAISTLVLARHHPAEARLQQSLDRLAVASALHTRGLIPWPDLVTRTRFSRAGVEGLASLAYGQSTLFVERLEHRHGRPALARFLTAIGEGASATQAFTQAFGPFGPAAADVEAALAQLGAELPPGLYVLQPGLTQPGRADDLAVLGVAGGTPGETATVELLTDGTLSRRELDLDGAGMLVASIPSVLLEDVEEARVRVRVPGLGTLEVDPRTAGRALPSASPRPTSSSGQPGPVQVPAPRPAPAQIPGRAGRLPALPSVADAA